MGNEGQCRTTDPVRWPSKGYVLNPNLKLVPLGDFLVVQ